MEANGVSKDLAVRSGMGHCRSEATSNSNSLAALHSGLEEQA